jgi:hypothetical protein
MAGKSPFAGAARSSTLDQSLHGGRWLEDGMFDVVIEDSNPSAAATTGKLALVFRAETGGSHRESLFILNYDKNAFNWAFCMLLGAVLQSAEAQQRFRDLLAREDTYLRVLECFRGMRVRITLESNNGYRIKTHPEDGTYSSELRDGTVIANHVRTATEAERWAKTAGHKKVFRSITRIEAIDHDTTQVNLQAFDNAASSIEKSSGTEGVTETNFDGYTGASPKR